MSDNDEILYPGLEGQDIKLISEVWNTKEEGIHALIKAGQLDPKKDFVRGDFRGWPLEGEDIRGIDFTGSDLRGTGIIRAIRDETTILTDAILDDLPSPARRPAFEEGPAPQTNAWTYHWHAGVYRAFGHKLFLIFLRFLTGSIVVEESVVRNLEEAGITDFLIFNLYSKHDVLIRVWADDSSMKRLQGRFRDNSEISQIKDIVPPPIEIADVKHFPDKGKYASLNAVRSLLTQMDTAQLKDVQQKVDRSEYFKPLRQAGLILDNDTRFMPNRIQFFIWVNCAHEVPTNLRSSLLD